MKRPWQVWLGFLVCSAVLVAAMGWLTVHAARVDRERSAARAEALVEQRVSLALWRMDTRLAPMIAQEIARPHAFYEPFLVLNALGTKSGVSRVPSPLLASLPENVLLNFTCSTGGQWSSPQCPPPEQRELAASRGIAPAAIDASCHRLAELSRMVDVGRLIAQLPSQPLPTWALANAQASQSIESNGENPFGDFAGEQVQADRQDPAQQQASTPALMENYLANAAAQQGASEPQGASTNDEMMEQAAEVQQRRSQKPAKGVADLGERNYRLQQAAQQEYGKVQAANSILLQNMAPAAEERVIESVSRPLWIGDQLLLARRVERGGQTYVQGSWLDWPRLKRELLAEAADLVPHADLAAVRGEEAAPPTRMLAALPVQLVAGGAATALGEAGDSDGPLHWALAFGWLALLAALAAVAGLLWGVLALSERRAAFVSSVTHELRTPLTTFRMYAEMLAREMVPTPERRREYLETLKTEAERLTHLVENVLAYARLERGRRPQRSERTTAPALVERFEPRLAERAARAEMRLQCVVDESARGVALVTDVGVVEQVLFNLVDNAAKYAARAEDRRIVLHAKREGGGVSFCVTDRGPGFASHRAAERAAPFHKSAQEAAETAPGVGLGLALCRRLAKELGGRLQVAPQNGHPSGASVTLWLPAD